MSLDIKLPELGEGISSGIVASISVEEGAAISANDPIIEIETDKAVLPVPCPHDGICKKILVAVGDEIQVGHKIAEIEDSGAAPAEENEKAEEKAEKEETTETPQLEEKPMPAPAQSEAPSQPAPSAEKKSDAAMVVTENKNNGNTIVAAGPATRKYARELGIDLTQVKGSRRGGRIDISDIKSYVKSLNLKDLGSGFTPMPSAGGAGLMAAAPLPDFSKYGSIRQEPLSRLRKIISERMARNWATIPHVFQYQDIDVTSLGEYQSKYASEFKEKGSSVSPTNFFIKALSICLKEFPAFNSSLDVAAQELIYKNYFHIGVAVDTPSGLIVPVLRDVDQKSIFDIGYELKELAQKTRDRKVLPEELQGACITLSNLGGMGGTHFTPIINAPEVAILGVGRAAVEPQYIDGELCPRKIAKVTLSYDHRVIDGADAARFVARLKDIVEHFDKILLGG